MAGDRWEPTGGSRRRIYMSRFTTILVLAVLLAACTTDATTAQPDVSSASSQTDLVAVSQPQVSTPRGVLAALEPVDDCDALLDYFIERALEQVGPWGLNGGPVYWEVATTEAAAADGADASAGGAEPSSTNVQVEGVDEGDIVKAAGDQLYVLSGGRLLSFSTAGGAIEKLGTLELSEQWGATQMLLDGDRLVVITPGFDHTFRPADGFGVDIAPAGSSLTELTLVDVSEPSEMAVLERLVVDGSAVTTRLVGGHLRLVLEAYPVGLDWATPEGSGLRAEREATRRNRRIVRQSTIENWLPYYVTDSDTEGTLLECSDVFLPPEPSGLGTLSILDFDLEQGIDSWEATSVVAQGATVYANHERTYVATQRWFDPATIESDDDFGGHTTRIHRFDTPVDGDLAYVASGDVDGFLLNQFAMDEHEDHLRVASTTTPSWWGAPEESVSQVTVLAVRDGRLAEVGSVGGLGRTETIRAVRFMGPVGYVVTFRQTDPLYVIDLSDPSDPRATGELKIPGFSAYLHPVAEGRLLGVGQDADPDTGAVRGLQLSLFDVSDPSDPRRLDTFGLDIDSGDEAHVWSPVEGDHKAFTLAGHTGFVPYEGWSWSEESESETLRQGLVVADWSDGTLDGSRILPLFDGKPTEEAWPFAPQRTVVKGDVIYAVGHGGIAVIDLPSGQVVERIRF